MLHIGLTGGIGSGKSTVAAILVESGAALIDTDAISRSLTLPGGTAIQALSTTFGECMLDQAGGLDRARMRELVFSDPAAKKQLESIMHTMIGAECNRQVETAHSASSIVFDIPLLVESRHWRARLDRILVVDVTAPTQVRRVLARSDWREATVLAVIAQQASRSSRRAAADAVIFNEALTLDQLSVEVKALFQYWTAQTRR